MDTLPFLVFALTFVAVAGALYAVGYTKLVDDRAGQRQKLVQTARISRTPAGSRDTALRRGQVAESLKELERRQKNARNPPLSVRIEQAGLSITPQRFYIYSALLGVTVGLALLVTATPLIALLGAFAGAVGIPRWVLKHITKRRQKLFIKEFPNAIDIIVRGVKTGLPLGDCFRIVASEAQDPVKSEFRGLLEMQAVGVSIAEAVERLYTRLGLSEANFFAIVIAIQAKSGGNLSEALGNLAHVLRERQKMRGKIQAMSMEAKSSAWIIGALPVCVGFFMYLLSPEYISLLWTETVGLFLLGGAAVWMTCGVLTMRKMINFDF